MKELKNASRTKKSLSALWKFCQKFCHSTTKNATIGCDDRFCLLINGICHRLEKLEEIKIVYLHFILFFVKA